ncbi:MAG: hypothetical protein ABA06_02405 [Parcubacteria bacterium C7867-001]|nr:MAG: hypothetical protein ABA06_02405 [Parcubacteria bacterium C7867-001]
MEKPVTTISITTGTMIRILVIVSVAAALWALRDMALLVITAIVLASAIEPGVAGIMRYKLPRVFAVLLMYVVVFGSLFSVVYFMFPPIVDDARGFVTGLPQYLETLDLPHSLDPAVTPLLSETQSQGQSLIDMLFAFQSAFGDPSGAVRVISSFFGGLFSLMLVIVLSFYFAIRDTGVDDFLRLVTPQRHEEYVVDLWQRAKRKIGLWMQGQLILSLLVGVLVYLGLLILGVPYALLLAVLAAIFDLIPIFGSPFAGVLAVIIALSSGGLTLGLLVAGWYFIVNQFEANLLYPLVVNKVVGIPPLLVILALIAGGTLAGFLGVLLSVPLAAALREFIDDLDRGKRAQTAV